MKTLLLSLAFIAFTSPGLHAENASISATVFRKYQAAETIFQKLLAAEKAKNYDGFIADGTTELKAALTKMQFEASSDLLKPKLYAGYDMDLMGDLNQKGYEIYLFRLRFKNGGDDILSTLSLKDGKVAGIYFK